MIMVSPAFASAMVFAMDWVVQSVAVWARFGERSTTTKRESAMYLATFTALPRWDPGCRR